MSDLSKPKPDPMGRETPLEGWKEIGAYLQRTERTVRRWEKKEALPVYRQVHESRTSVYAFPNELDRWRAHRLPCATDLPAWRWPLSRPLSAFAATVTLALMLLTVGGMPRDGTVNAQSLADAGLTIHRVWVAASVGERGGLSADGGRLAFTDWDTGDLAVRDLTSGKTLRLTNKGSWKDSAAFAEFPTISPDGGQVAYTWYDPTGSTHDLRLATLEGPKVRVLLKAGKEEFPRATGWSADGKQILVAWYSLTLPARPTGRGFEYISVADGARQGIKSPPLYRGPGTNMRSFRPASLSPDGQYVAFDQAAAEAAGQRDVFILATDGKRQPWRLAHPADDWDPVWTPDGKGILFASDRTGGLGFWMADVAEGQVQGAPKLVRPDLGRLGDIVGFTKTGSLYYSLEVGGEDVFVAELDPEKGSLQGQPKRITELFLGSNTGPVWSPDGAYLAYHSRRGPAATGAGSLTIVIRSIQTGEERLIPTALAQVAPVCWFPDNRSLLITAGARARNHYRVEVRSGEISLVHQPAVGRWYDHTPALSPDGNTIYFARTEHDGSDGSRVFLVMGYDIQSRRETEIHRFAAGEDMGRTIRVSPDGKQLAFIVNWSSVRIMPATGGRPRELLRISDSNSEFGRQAISWSPDGQHLYVVKNASKSELIRVPVHGGEPQSVGTISMPDIQLGGVHPDGRRIVFRAGAPKNDISELWVMENLLPGHGSGK